jgi:hypothetical protein
MEETMKSLRWLWSSILEEMSMRCDTDTHLDARTVSRRIEHEGISFLTISLPAFCSDFERGLDRGWVGPDLFCGYKKRFGLPAFLQGFLGQVFDPVSGRLLGCPSTEAILCIRQFCLMWKKVNLPCTLTRTRRTIDAYVQVEQDLENRARSGDGEARDKLPLRELSLDLRRVASLLWQGGLGRIYESISDQVLVPRHGPGAVRERGLRGNAKFCSWLPLPVESGKRGNSVPGLSVQNGTFWHQRLETTFPLDAYGVPNAAWLNIYEGESLDAVKFLDPDAEPPVRVVTVPKTQKGPRIIAIEPACMQYTQQALLGAMVDIIESSRGTAGHVNFSDQSINQRLALESSMSGRHATLDLSEASDRVSLSLAELVFGCVPDLWDALLACRSTRAELPDGRVIDLWKFASMGSAVCFPVESMVFYALCILARLRSASLPITYRNIFRVSREVYVYGDDLIVPADEVEAVTDVLELFGLKVNDRKSFWTGKFRESCGTDAYNGVNVTPVYVRNMPPRNRRNVPEILSFVSLANQLYMHGWWGTAARVRDRCEAILGPLPHVQETSPCLGWRSVTNAYSVHRWNRDLFRFEVKAPTVAASMRSDRLTGGGALMKYFLKQGLEPSFEGHLERSVRPGCARIKVRWGTPH